MQLFLEKPFEEWGTQAFDRVRTLQGDVARALETRKTLRFEWKGKGYFAKYHRGGSAVELLKNLASFRLPVFSAKNEWEAVRHLRSHGIDTLHAVAYGLRGTPPLWTESFLITEELTECISLEDVFLSGLWFLLSVSERRALVTLLATTVKRMHEAGVNHRDCYLCHFLWQRSANRLYIIDLHRSQVRARVPKRWLLKDVASLYFSAVSFQIPKTYFFRFARVYGWALILELWPFIEKKARKIEEHNHSLKKKRGFL